MSVSERPSAVIDIVERPIHELSALRDVQPPPALVARVMTQLSEPRLPSLWQWLLAQSVFDRAQGFAPRLDRADVGARGSVRVHRRHAALTVRVPKWR